MLPRLPQCLLNPVWMEREMHPFPWLLANLWALHLLDMVLAGRRNWGGKWKNSGNFLPAGITSYSSCLPLDIVCLNEFWLVEDQQPSIDDSNVVPVLLWLKWKNVIPECWWLCYCKHWHYEDKFDFICPLRFCCSWHYGDVKRFISSWISLEYFTTSLLYMFQSYLISYG